MDLVQVTSGIAPTETFSSPGIPVGVASAGYTFAMKASAARSEVLDDGP